MISHSGIILPLNGIVGIRHWLQSVAVSFDSYI